VKQALPALLAFIILAAAGSAARAQQRFPPPDFETGYRQPELDVQTRGTFTQEVMDAAVLLAAIGIGAWFLLKRRSRSLIFVLGVFCLLYLGFYKEGCICPVGSIQNVALALSDPDYAVSLVVIVVFIAPLVAALVFGRVFCGMVCPLGAIQDIFLVKPVRLPRWLEGALGLVKYFFLGIVVYAVFEGGIFLVCRYDPFVGFFRLSGRAYQFILGAAFLLAAIVIGRPYCRFVCPYGALLSIFSRWSTYRVRITPDECIKCTLCDDACPFGAIRRPADDDGPSRSAKIMLWAAALASVASLAVLGYCVMGGRISGLFVGLWFGLVIAAKLVSLAGARQNDDYEVDRANCLSCGRCYMACPRERQRLKEKSANNGK